jgi:hypothetical protein
MDQALTIINLNEEVSNKTIELEDSKPSADTTAPPLPPSTVKQSVTFALNEQISKNNTMSNKKKKVVKQTSFLLCTNPGSPWHQDAPSYSQKRRSANVESGHVRSRANCQASDPTFLAILQYDYAALTRWPSIKFNNNATLCYDRIIPSVSNVTPRSMGRLHKNIAQIHGDMLEQAVYHIKTQLGISNGSYSHSDVHPVYGTGQGSCASPPFWLLNCSKYFDLYDILCCGAKYIDMAAERLLKMGLDGYVDDNGCNVNSLPFDKESLVERARHDAQLWSNILWSSSGALEHSKCSYCYLQTEFTTTGCPYFRGGKFGAPIQIKDAKGTLTPLDQLSAYVPFKTLGTYQAATHCQTMQFTVLQQKARALT